MSLTNCKLISLPKIYDPRGNLTFIEGGNHINFKIAQIHYLYDLPTGSFRGAHANKTLHQLIVPMSGSFDVQLEDGKNTQIFNLNRPFLGLYIPPKIWQKIDNFSSGSVCLVLSSQKYDESDYCRDYDQFLNGLV